jgi:hypothetical protein
LQSSNCEENIKIIKVAGNLMNTDLVSQRWRIMLKQTSKTTVYSEDMEQDFG